MPATTTTVSGKVTTSGVAVSGASIALYLATRFSGTPPQQNTAVPSGTADYSTSTASDGTWSISGVNLAFYWLAVSAAGVISWTPYNVELAQAPAIVTTGGGGSTFTGTVPYDFGSTNHMDVLWTFHSGTNIYGIGTDDSTMVLFTPNSGGNWDFRQATVTPTGWNGTTKARLTSAGALLATDGSSSNPGLAFLTQPSLGFYRVSAGNIGTTGHLVPHATTTDNLGGSTARWNTIYGVAADISGALTAGATTLGATTATTLEAVIGSISRNSGRFTTVDANSTITASGRISALLTTEQLRLSYDAGHYLSATINSNGDAALALIAGSNVFTLTGIVTATSIQNTPIGTTTRAAGGFTTLDANSTLHVTGAVTTDTTIAAGGRISALLTTEQLRASYDASNYLAVTVASNGDAALALKGSSSTATLTGIFTATSIQATPIGSTTRATIAGTTIDANSTIHATGAISGDISITAGSTLTSTTSTAVTTFLTVGSYADVTGPIGLGVTHDATKGKLYLLDSTGHQFRFGYDATHYAQLLVDNAGNTTIDSPQNAITIQPGSASGYWGSAIYPYSSLATDLGGYNRKNRVLYAGELIVDVLVAQSVLATIGGRIMVAPTSKLFGALLQGATTLTLDNYSGTFVANDYIYSATAPGGVAQYELIKLGTKSGPTTDPTTGRAYYTFTGCTRDADAHTVIAGPTVTPVGATGATSYSYYLVVTYASGDSVASAVTTITNGNATLNGSNYNTISWTAREGATGYKVLKGGTSGTVKLATLGSGTLTTNDQGGALSAHTAGTLRRGNSWQDGDAAVNTGGSAGSGGLIELTSTVGYIPTGGGAVQTNGPNVTIYSRTSTAYNSLKPTVAFGSLKGLADIGANDYHGIAFGNDLTLTPTTGFKGMVADANNASMRLFNVDLVTYNSATPTAQIRSSDGQLLLGTNITAGATITFGVYPTAFTLGSDNLAAGSVLIGPNTKGNALWDGTDLHIRQAQTQIMSFLTTTDSRGYYARFRQPIDLNDGGIGGFGAFGTGGTFASPAGSAGSAHGGRILLNGGDMNIDWWTGNKPSIMIGPTNFAFIDSGGVPDGIDWQLQSTFSTYASVKGFNNTPQSGERQLYLNVTGSGTTGPAEVYLSASGNTSTKNAVFVARTDGTDGWFNLQGSRGLKITATVETSGAYALIPTSGYMLDVRGAGLFSGYLTLTGQHRLRLYKSSAHAAIANTTATTLDFNAQNMQAGFAYSSGNTITILVAGDYHLTAQVIWPANATGVRITYLMVNGAAVAYNPASAATGGNEAGSNCSTSATLAVNDVVRCDVYQSSGGNLTPNNGANISWLLVEKVR